MAYTTSSATNASGILDAIRLFAVAQGWTVNYWATYSNGYWLSIEYDGMFFNFYSDDTAGSIYAKGATAFSSSNSWYNQAGSYYLTSSSVSYAVTCNDLLGGPFAAHHLFAPADGTYIYCVIEVSSGRYTFIGFGRLNQLGTWTGGEFLASTKWYLNSVSYSGNAYYSAHRLPFSTASSSSLSALIRFVDHYSGTSEQNDWLYGYGTISGDVFWGGILSTYSPAYMQYLRSPSNINGVSPLICPQLFSKNSSGNFVCLGTPPDWRYINIKNITPGTTLTYGAEDWMVFPIKQKGTQISGDSTPFSHWFGMAIKKIT